MSHLSLVPPLEETRTAAPARTVRKTTAGTVWSAARTPDAAPAHPVAYDDPNVALLFFQAASGVCLCRECAMRRHPAYGAR